MSELAKPETITVKLKDVVVLPGRGRKEFKGIIELSESIKRLGFIHPMTVTTDPAYPGKYILVAGERRWRASVLAGLVEVPVTLRTSIPTLEQKCMELEENVERSDLSWPEQIELHRQIDDTRRKLDPNWTKGDTAKLVNLDRGHVGKQIELAKRLKEDKGLMDAVKHLDFNSAIKVVARKDEVKKVERLQAQGQLKITVDLRLGSCVELIKNLPTASVDLLLTDPPYGLELLNTLSQDTSAGSTYGGHRMMNKTHNMTLPEVLAMLNNMGKELSRVLKPGAHAYVFAPFQYVGEFIKALEPLEFQPPLVIWKRNKPTTPGLGYNYLSYCEAIIFLHNPPRSKRLLNNVSQVLEHGDVSPKERVYPTEKPQTLLRQLIENSTILGDTVLDICAGSASTLKAALSCGRKAIGFEIDEEAYKRALLHLSEGAKDGK